MEKSALEVQDKDTTKETQSSKEFVTENTFEGSAFCITISSTTACMYLIKDST